MIYAWTLSILFVIIEQYILRRNKLKGAIILSFAIDLFCGAGGFSEGILQAGFDIIFSSDRSPMVKETYVNRHEQLGIEQNKDTFFELCDIRDLKAEYIFEKINGLKYGKIFKKGKIDVIFGGPPCQGFSRLGKRDSKDPRNMLFHEYLRIIRDVNPKYVVMENVTGILDMMMLDFPSVLSDKSLYEGQQLVPEILKEELTGLGYNVLPIQTLNAANFGVPQQRNRAIFLAYRNDVKPIKYPEITKEAVTVKDALAGIDNDHESAFAIQSVIGRTPNPTTKLPFKANGLTNMEYSRHDVAVAQRFALYHQGENKRKAIERLKKEGINLQKEFPELFFEVLFQVNSLENEKIISKYLKENAFDKNIRITKLWLNHTNKVLSHLSYATQQNEPIDIEKSFKTLSRKLKASVETSQELWSSIKENLNTHYSIEKLDYMLKSGDIDENIADALFTKKGIRTRLNADSVSPTIVTLPDDYIHPFLNRVLTVREMARLQSFDDSFQFLGKRTTGGQMRAKETPQFTQVGNAVPPLLAKAIAISAMDAIKSNQTSD
jgi:DNA (cytosine-5)-methyltransferase 1